MGKKGDVEGMTKQTAQYVADKWDAEIVELEVPLPTNAQQVSERSL